MAPAHTFWIVSYRGYLTIRDDWAEKLYAAAFKDLASIRHNMRRLRDYKPDIFQDVEGATDENGRLYLLEDLCL